MAQLADVSKLCGNGKPVPEHLQFDLSLMALIAQQIQRCDIPFLPWGQIALSYHGVPTVVNRYEFVVPDRRISDVEQVISQLGIPRCNCNEWPHVSAFPKIQPIPPVHLRHPGWAGTCIFLWPASLAVPSSDFMFGNDTVPVAIPLKGWPTVRPSEHQLENGPVSDAALDAAVDVAGGDARAPSKGSPDHESSSAVPNLDQSRVGESFAVLYFPSKVFLLETFLQAMLQDDEGRVSSWATYMGYLCDSGVDEFVASLQCRDGLFASMFAEMFVHGSNPREVRYVARYLLNFAGDM